METMTETTTYQNADLQILAPKDIHLHNTPASKARENCGRGVEKL